eukprot:2117119-Pleurochrysis_carterae.AAC.3
MSLTKGNYHVPGYSGFVPGVQSENLFAGTYAKITSSADTIRDRKLDSAVRHTLHCAHSRAAWHIRATQWPSLPRCSSKNAFSFWSVDAQVVTTS